ncbi:MAG: hypothetical protein V3W34_20690 [Phycisphaerae bacterium]
MRTRLHILVSACVFGVLLGCEQSDSLNDAAATNEPLASERHGDFYRLSDWYPAADGSLYLLDFDGNLWCVRGVEAVKVKKVGSFSRSADALNATIEGWNTSLCEKRVRDAREAATESAWQDAYESFQDSQPSEWDREDRYPG